MNTKWENFLIEYDYQCYVKDDDVMGVSYNNDTLRMHYHLYW